TSKSSAIRWLLDSDPSIRWQVLRDLTDAPAGEVGAERARVATEGAGARLLALQAPDGRWGGAAWNRGWDSTMHVLSLLREMGLDPASDEARRAVGLVRDRVTWQGCGPQEADGNPFFTGEVEPCINGQVAPLAATCPLMHGSTSPVKKGLPSASCGPHPCHVTRSRTRPTARRASSLAGSRPISRRSDRTCIVESHPRFHAAPPHRPSGAWRASSRAPAPSVATLARSAPTSPAGASVRSRNTCQRIEGSESSSQRIAELFDVETCRSAELVAICWFLLTLVK